MMPLPADWPIIITMYGSPPNTWIYSLVHFSAAQASYNPALGAIDSSVSELIHQKGPQQVVGRHNDEFLVWAHAVK
jgi:hypothetical protein